MNGVFAEGLVRRVDVDLHVNEFETRIHFLVQKGEKGSDVFGTLISRLDAEIGKVGQFQCAFLREQRRRFLRSYR